MPRESISTSGWNSAIVHLCLVPRAVLHFLVLFALIPAAFAQAQQPVAPSTEPIRVSVDRVNVGVIVTNSRGNFVEGLRREDFQVFDDGVEQPLTDFAAIEEPAQVLLLVEAGPAVYFLEASHLQAAHSLLDGLSAGDRVAVVKYDEAPQLVLDFTPDKQAAAAALANVRFNIGFGMLNLSQSLSTVLDWLGKTPGKKTIVLLSTGVDTSPDTASAAILMRLKTSDVRILAASLSAELRTPSPTGRKKISSDKSAVTAKAFADADHLLTQMTEATGGRVYFPKDAKDFSAAYTEIAQLVRHEYSLAFAPPNRDAKVHAVEVRVSPAPSATPATPAPTYRVDYRRAYLAPAPAPD